MNDLSSHAVDWREGRRLRAWELSQPASGGWRQKDIAAALGVTKGAVSQWLKRAKQEGPESLRRRKPSGAPPRLTDAQRQELPRLLERGPEAHGFRGGSVDRGTHRPGHPAGLRGVVPPLPCGAHPACLRMEPAKAGAAGSPAERGSDPPLARRALARGKKGAEEEGRSIVFVDESGFYLLPSVVRTFAPRGKTPVLRERWTRDHLSAISGITPDGKLYMMVQEMAYKSTDVVRFLRHLHRHIPGKVLVLWDGAPIHRSNVIKDFLATGAARWLQLDRLPAYAPEMNPDEGVWHHLKGVELKNLTCQHVPQLQTELRKAKERLRHKHHVIRACFARPGLFTV